MTRRHIAPPRAVTDAAVILGQQIRQARLEKKMTIATLAGRAMVSPRTITQIENGDPAVSLGNVFAAAHFAGVRLFGAETPQELQRQRRIGSDILALMPSREVPVKLGDDGLDF